MQTKRIFQLIDLDRTLFDTALFAKCITDAINKTQPGLGTQLNKKFEDAYKNEVTFFLLRFLREEMGDEAFEAFIHALVMREGPERFILPGVNKRLQFADTLTSLRPAWGILSFGDDIDQQMKLRISGFGDAPFLLTETPDKAAIIASWQNDDGTFTLPAVFGRHVVDEITFEDDKIRAFEGIPENVFGIWITQFEDADERIKEAQLPITHAADMAGSIQRLKNHFE